MREDPELDNFGMEILVPDLDFKAGDGALTKLSPLRNQFLGLYLVPLSVRKVSQLIPGGQQEGKYEVVHQVQGENSQR